MDIDRKAPALYIDVHNSSAKGSPKAFSLVLIINHEPVQGRNTVYPAHILPCDAGARDVTIFVQCKKYVWEQFGILQICFDEILLRFRY